MSSKPNLSILAISFTSGGAEKVMSLLLKELVHDYNVYLILFYNEIHFPIPPEVNVIMLTKKSPDRKFYQKATDLIGFVFKYNKIVKQEKISYAVSFLAFPNLVNGIIATFNKKVRTYISERGFPSDNTTSKLSLAISKIFYPLLYNRCYKLFSNSVYINKDLKDNFGISIPMEIVYNPIELPANVIIPESLQINPKSFKVINVGTLNVRKNQKMIIKALQNLDDDYELEIFGSGPLEKQLKEYTAEVGLEDKVSLGGRVKNVNDYLLKNHCFVLSSHTEGFPNALLEAMAMGLPSISTNCLSGPLELLNDDKPVVIPNGSFFKASYGILINNDDHIGLAGALRYLRSNAAERVNYSRLSLARAEQFELKNIYKQFKEFIHN
ncbi:glycosyltransferase [Spongiimicrobium sp. 3-5]|uniref:glycosyltransferase n=1 Tax=Spongiimicrobium sp. 3-5 TaxID=3332596 RepID=UPI00397EDF7D